MNTSKFAEAARLPNGCRVFVQTPFSQSNATVQPPNPHAAVLSRPDLSPAQKHEVIANGILKQVTTSPAGPDPVPGFSTGAGSRVASDGVAAPGSSTRAAVARGGVEEDEPVAVMRRYMEQNGELAPTPKEAPPRPQLTLDPERIAQVGQGLDSLSHADRQGVVVKLHDKLAQAIAEQKKFLGPDGQLHVVSSPAEAAKVAQKIINDSISEHDQRVAEQQNQPVSIMPRTESPALLSEQQGSPVLPQRRTTQESVPDERLLSSKKATQPAAGANRLPSSSDDAARIDPNFRLDPTNANLMHVEVIRRQGKIPPVIVLDHIAYQVVARAYGSPVDGLNLSLERAKQIAGSIRRQAATEPSRLIRTKLIGLARTLDRATFNHEGLSIVRNSGRTKAEFKAIQEELFHAFGQRRPGKGSIRAGTPHEVLARDPDFQKLQPRVQGETNSNDPVTFVAEAMQDIWANEAPELSEEEQSRSAEKYWIELARKVGDEALTDIPELWQYLQRLARSRYNLTETKDVMNEKAFEALQRVIARRVRPQGEGIQRTDQPPSPGVLPEHRGREETEGDSRKDQEPRTGAGTGRGEIEPGDLERPLTTSQSVFLSNGRPVTIQYISPKMGVARVRTADGQSRTVKLSEIQIAKPGSPTRAGVARGGVLDMRNPPEMGHNMTSDSPAVRRAKVEATPVRGQEPTIKVKQEPPQIQEALTQQPAPVNEEEAALIGQRDPQSGRQILQPSNDIVQNERLANQAAPELNTRLSRIAAETPGAKFDRLRPQKGLRRLQEKVADGKPANTIGDNLAAQIVASTEKAKDQIIAGLSREFRVISVDDKFLEPRNKAGYPSTNVQVQMPNGTTAEVQIVAPEVQKITDKTHQYYTLGRNYPEGSPQRAWYWDQAAAMHMQALEKFQARTAAEQLAATLPPGQRVVLKNGQTGKIVGFTNKLDRVVVRTSKGLKTVKPADVTPLITRMDQAVSPKASPASEQHFIAAARRVGPQLSDPRPATLATDA